MINISKAANNMATFDYDGRVETIAAAFQPKTVGDNVVLNPMDDPDRVFLNEPYTNIEVDGVAYGSAAETAVALGEFMGSFKSRWGSLPPTQEKNVDITENGTAIVTPDAWYALSKVTANVNVPPTPTQEKNVDITENGATEVTPDEGYALSKVTVEVDVAPVLQEKEVEITENGSTEIEADEGYDGLSKVTVDVNVPTGGGDSSKPVLFFDYDGTLLHSYTIAEAQALTELPARPTHDGLTEQGWTHTLAEVNGVVNALHVGAQYKTTNGRTKFCYTLTPVTGLEPTIYIGGTGSYTVYWPDGTPTSYTGVQAITKTHADFGDFEAEIDVTEGEILLGQGDYSTTFFGGSSEVYKQALTSIFIGGATSIGNSAFHNYSSLASIVIPDGVTSIGTDAFQACYSLTSIVIPDGVTSIGDGAFSDCPSLASIVIPDSVTSIGTYAFSDCPSLTSIVIPDGVTSIGDGAFQVCSSLVSIVIPVGVTSIGTYAFSDCPSLTSIVIPDGVTSIGDGAFQACYSLTSIVIPDGVTSIGTYAFSDCPSLASIVIPDSVTSIGDGAFQVCSSLVSIVIPVGVTSIGTYAFSDCPSLTSIVIPDGVTSIGDGAFQACYSLTSIVIPDGVTSIESNTFNGCYSLTSIVIPDGVTSIGGIAFRDCYSLTSIVIPDGVTSIESNTFNGCYSIKEYIVERETPPTLANVDAFTGIVSICKIYVPDTSVEAYKDATNWDAYANYIYPISERL